MNELDVVVTARQARFLHEAAVERSRPPRHGHRRGAQVRRFATALHLVHAAPECACEATAAT